MLPFILTCALGALTAPGIWGEGKPQYVWMRYEDTTPFEVKRAVLYIGAVQSGPQQKLLGAYKAYLNGKAVGIGPGRGECAVQSSSNRENCTLYDTIEVTDYIPQNGTLAVGVQAFHSTGEGQVALKLWFETTNQAVTWSSGSNWKAFTATPYYNPYTTTGGDYDAPRENIVASNLQQGWILPGFALSSSWKNATTSGTAVYPPKVTQPLQIQEGVKPAVQRVNSSYVLFDFGEEIMAGVELRIDMKGYIQVTLGEELVEGTQEVLYPMRTGNHYRYIWEADGQAVFSLHEYALFRYGSLRFCTKASKDACEDDQSVGDSFDLSAWSVRYPWHEGDSSFNSSDDMLNKVWKLCKDTIRVTSLDTTTDSNTRERLPYEADGFITGVSRFIVQSGSEWQLHSARHQFLNPTWPTEWHQFMALIAHKYYMETGDLSLAADNWDILVTASMVHCVNPATQLLDFSTCSRNGTRDIVDWPQNYRDGYVMTDINTVVNAFMVGALDALAILARALGRHEAANSFVVQADRTAKAMVANLFNTSTGLFNDGLLGAQNHSAWHAQTNTLWFLPGYIPHKDAMLKFLTAKRVTGSVYGVYSMLQGLYQGIPSDYGRLALQMMTQCDVNSWCHMLQVNATATMEAWSREGKPNLSWSHPWATGALAAIKEGLMGLRAQAPKYEHWIIKPQPGSLTSASAVFPVMAGGFAPSIKVAIEAQSDRFTLSYTSPPETKGTVCLPLLQSSSSPTLQLDGRPVNASDENGYLCAAVPEGTHEVVLEY